MAKPVVLTVDDDPDVLRAVERDLRRRYGERYRIVRADSGKAALDALGKLKLRNDQVALFVADQRMPEMSGVEFLQEARRIFPDAKSTLLTAYADTEAAIQAINLLRLDFYLLKPWDPPDERLYPVIDDLLDDWERTNTPPFEGLRVVGPRRTLRGHEVRDFLSRYRVPYVWIDITTEEAGRLLEQIGPERPRLPLVLFSDGSYLGDPSQSELADKLGLKTRPEHPFYDVIVVGAGPAGLAAGVYGASEGLETAIIERDSPGGQAGMSSRIENYLGFPTGLSGADLAQRAVIQARRLGAEILAPQTVVGLRREDPYRIVSLADGSELSCHALLVATGVSYRWLEVPGMDRLTGAGIYYGAAMTEAASCEGDDVYIIGGANSAGQAAMFFSKYARSVTLLVRGKSVTDTMSAYLIDELAERPNVSIRTHTEVVAVDGKDCLEQITIENNQTRERETLPTSSMFIFIGAQPRTDWLADIVERDKYGFILAGPDMMRDGKRPKGWNVDRDPFLLETSVPGIFVAGDVRSGSVKRVASGVGEGSIAISFIHRHLADL